MEMVLSVFHDKILVNGRARSAPKHADSTKKAHAYVQLHLKVTVIGKNVYMATSKHFI